ncbi:MAG: type II methionyl aminopeptidase [Candidatus Methanomethylicaceae archaeon]
MLAEDEVEKLIKAGKVVREVRKNVPSFVSEGARVFEICEKVEEEIRKLGAEPAFPCNVGIDSVGAHYTSPPGDATIIPPGCLVKIDLGAHVDGYIADSALTVSIDSEYEDMIRVADEALERAVQAVSVGGRVADVGVAVEKTIRSRGFRPISNLTGHQIAKYTIHAGVSIPNVGPQEVGGGRFEPWSVYALEPFVTLPDAVGSVRDAMPGNILAVVKIKGPKDAMGRRLFDETYKRFRTLPFSKRWISKSESFEAWKRLVAERVFYEYPVLVESSGKPIAQGEHTVLTTKREVIVTT